MSSTDNMTNWHKDWADEIMRGRCVNRWRWFRNMNRWESGYQDWWESSRVSGWTGGEWQVWEVSQKWVGVWLATIGKSTGVNNEINDGWRCLDFRCLVSRMLAHCHSHFEPLNRTEPLLVVVFVLFLLWQVNMSAVRKAYAWALEKCLETGTDSRTAK